MPSPFPGMDPYAEDPAIWPNMHHRLITGISSALNAVLPANYVASIGERVVVSGLPGEMYPDVAVIGGRFPTLQRENASTTVAEYDEPMVLISPHDDRIEPFIQIVRARDWTRVIVEMEVLSPSNKAKGSRGREQYLTKQNLVMNSGAHLIEIDLLRDGTHTAACPRPSHSKTGRCDFLVSLHRAGDASKFSVWARSIREPLPKFEVPLDEGVTSAVVDLQAAFTRCYDEGRFGSTLDYSKPPEVKLNPEVAEWAADLLQAQDVR